MKQKLTILVLCLLVMFGCTNPEQEATGLYNQARLEALDNNKVEYEETLREVVKKYPQTSIAKEIISELEKIKVAREQKERMAATELKIKNDLKEMEEYWKNALLKNKAGSILLTGLEGKFIPNKTEGELFIINGTATNKYLKPKVSIKVNGSIFDKAGTLLLKQGAVCGNPISDEAAQKLSFAEIVKKMEKPMASNLKPGETISFSIVFRKLPKSLSEFVVNVGQVRSIL